MRTTYLAIALCAIAALGACKRANEGVEESPQISTTAVDGGSATDTASATTTAATGGTTSNMADTDKTFVVTAGEANLAEIQMGELGVAQAANAAVKTYAQRMVTDHTKANAELAQLATTKGLALPTVINDEHQKGVEHLKGLAGAEFDKAFIEHMLTDHQKAVNDFTTASTTAQDADVKGWAAKTLPTLQDHLEQAQQIQAKLK